MFRLFVKSSSGTLRYRSKTRSSSALWDPQRLHISSIQYGSVHDRNYCHACSHTVY